MIMKGSQRGGAVDLALHLTNEADNDHITLHKIDGFVASDLLGALREADAIASCTKCPQFLFSLSINPPQHEYASIDDLEKAADRAGKLLGLSDQPHAMVVHEKEGRRHAHVVWSRIEPSELKSINLPYFKNKLKGLSKELFLEHGWELPRGHRENGWKNPLNFTLAEWQQAKRLDMDPREIKQIFRQAWERSDGLKAYAYALSEHGYFLCQGDRRGFVAIDLHGEVYSVARWSGVKTKDVKLKLGDPSSLPSVSSMKQELQGRLTEQLKDHYRSSHERQKRELVPLIAKRGHLIHGHRRERVALGQKQEQRRCAENRQRNERLRSGLLGVWDHLTGKAADIKSQNERDAYRCFRRDRKQREMLFIAQMKERKALQVEMRGVRDRHKGERRSLKKRIVALLAHREMTPSTQMRRRGFATRDLLSHKTINHSPKLER